MYFNFTIDFELLIYRGGISQEFCFLWCYWRLLGYRMLFGLSLVVGLPQCGSPQFFSA